MASRPFPLIQTVPVASGPPEYESLRDSIIQERVNDRVPEEFYLPQHVIDNPPKNVTSIPSECGILTEAELAITSLHDATSLARAIRNRDLTAAAVATAFSKRAIVAHQLTCCLTEWFMDEALAQARALDEHMARTGGPVGPLHGVPVSIKEHMHVAGHVSSDGYVASRTLDREDSHLVSILRGLGAVFYCKTNQPQAIMHLESVSPYGRVLNPHNVGLSAGGSSGGEGALIALRGSVLGVGTDIGGSIRGPAGFCGIYGFKPTSYVMPQEGMMHGGFAAELNVLVANGPMCTSLRDMDLLVRAVLGERPWLHDPRLVPIPWTGLDGVAAAGKKKLKIGVMMNDGDVQPQPPVTRALEWAGEQLQRSGEFELKPFAPYRAAEAIRNIRKAYYPDGANPLKEGLARAKEPMEPLTRWIIKDAEGPEMTATQVMELRVARDAFRSGFADHWTGQDVDVVLCPVFVGPACAHDTALYWNYTAFWNYVDCPGVVFPTPVKALKKGEEDYAEGVKEPLSEACKHVRQFWAEGDFVGAPINLQVVARKYHDNKLFAALHVMREALGLDSGLE